MIRDSLFPSPFSGRRLFFGALLLVTTYPALAAEGDVKSLLAQARVYEKAEDYAGAERTYRQALSLTPDEPEVLKRLGILVQTELKFADSIEFFRRALAISPQYSEVNFYLGASDLIPESQHQHPRAATTIMTLFGAAVIYFAVRIAGT